MYCSLKRECVQFLQVACAINLKNKSYTKVAGSLYNKDPCFTTEETRKFLSKILPDVLRALMRKQGSTNGQRRRVSQEYRLLLKGMCAPLDTHPDAVQARQAWERVCAWCAKNLNRTFQSKVVSVSPVDFQICHERPYICKNADFCLAYLCEHRVRLFR